MGRLPPRSRDLPPAESVIVWPQGESLSPIQSGEGHIDTNAAIRQSLDVLRKFGFDHSFGQVADHVIEAAARPKSRKPGRPARSSNKIARVDPHQLVYEVVRLERNLVTLHGFTHREASGTARRAVRAKLHCSDSALRDAMKLQGEANAHLDAYLTRLRARGLIQP